MRKLLFTFMMLVSSVNSFGLVVFDPKSFAQSVKQWNTTMQQWKETVKHYTAQKKMFQDQLSSLTGMRDLGNLEQELKSLKSELSGISKNREMLNKQLGSSNPQQQQETDALLNKYQMFNICSEQGSKRLDNICKEEIINKVATIEVGDKIRAQTVRKMDEVAKLARKAQSSKDVKESQDLTNAIALKDLEIQELKNQWDSFVDESNLREKLIEKKRYEAFREHQRNAQAPNVKF